MKRVLNVMKFSPKKCVLKNLAIFFFFFLKWLNPYSLFIFEVWILQKHSTKEISNWKQVNEKLHSKFQQSKAHANQMLKTNQTNISSPIKWKKIKKLQNYARALHSILIFRIGHSQIKWRTPRMHSAP
jgi:hypothetical protein